MLCPDCKHKPCQCANLGCTSPSRPDGDLPFVGGNDETHVWCAFCGWKERIYSIEQCEHLLNEHLKREHGTRVVYRKDDDGRRTYV